jgi:serine/threonine-protein phosphatase 2A activator
MEIPERVIPTLFVKPVTKIKSNEMLKTFLESELCKNYLQFLEDLNESVCGKERDIEVTISPIVEKMLAFLAKCSVWLDEIPPIDQPMRFGNKAFRIWLEKIEENGEQCMKDILPEHLQDAAIELATYFYNSLGNKVRIDYGTGHETAFMAWLYCFYTLGLIGPTDFQAIVFKVFYTYILLTRKFLKQYGLEPAGSQGVWSLDDHHFLIFYFGSSQLRGHKWIKPSSLKDRDLIEDNYSKFIYIDGVRNIYLNKNGPFTEHSPVLHSITSVPHWEKVNGGMMKMYKDLVIGKFPVMQHFLFGNIIHFDA